MAIERGWLRYLRLICKVLFNILIRCLCSVSHQTMLGVLLLASLDKQSLLPSRPRRFGTDIARWKSEMETPHWKPYRTCGRGSACSALQYAFAGANRSSFPKRKLLAQSRAWRLVLLVACVFRLGFLRSDNDAKPLRRTKRQVRDCCFIAWKRKHKKAQVNKHKKTQESARKHAMKCAPVIIATAD